MEQKGEEASWLSSTQRESGATILQLNSLLVSVLLDEDLADITRATLLGNIAIFSTKRE